MVHLKKQNSNNTQVLDRFGYQSSQLETVLLYVCGDLILYVHSTVGYIDPGLER